MLSNAVVYVVPEPAEGLKIRKGEGEQVNGLGIIYPPTLVGTVSKSGGRS